MKNIILASASLASLSLASAPRAVHAAPRADANDPAALIGQLNAAFEEFKTAQDEKLNAKADDSVLNEKIDRINESMSTIEASIEDAQRKLAAASLGAGDLGPSDPEHIDQIKSYMRQGKEPTVQAAMTEGTDADGGFLVPVEWDRTITDKLKQRSPIRDNAQVITTTRRGFSRVYNDGVIGSGWVGETAARPETTTPGLTTLNFDTGELYANPAVSQRMLDDAGFDLEAWLASEVDGEFAIQENIAFLSGNGSNKPFGLLTYVTGGANATKHPFGAIAATTAASTTALDADEIIAMAYSLPSERQANSKFYLNRATLKDVRTLKDGQGNYLWQPSYVAGEPSTLLGYATVEVPGMPTPAAGAIPMLFGDMEMTYLVIDRIGTTILRDPFTNKPFVHFYTTKRVGGGVQNPEYMKALKMAAA